MATPAELLSMAPEQNITMQLFDGTNVTFTAGDIDYFNSYNVQICISYAAQLGASVMLLIVVMVLSRGERRKTLMFILNALALVLNLIRLIIFCLYYTGPWSEAYVFFAGAYDLVPSSAYATSIAPVIFNVLTLICVEACLVLQAQVVLITLPKMYRHGILLTSILVATATVSFNIVLSVYNIRAIINIIPDSNFDHITDVANILVTVSICWFSAIFTAKLGHAIIKRRKMGLQSFGPMDILFIMGGQTMIVPAIFSIASYASSVPSLYSNIITATVIFLPLSSIWASAIIEGRRSANDKSPRNGSATLRNTTGRSGSSGSAKLLGSKLKAGILGRKRASNNYSSAVGSPTASVDYPGYVRHEQVSIDLEKQGV